MLAIRKHTQGLFKILFIFIISAFVMPSCGPDELDGFDKNNLYLYNKNSQSPYHSPEALENFLYKTNQKYPEITYLEPVGTSIEGRTIWAFVISDRPLDYEPEPKIRLSGSIHGNENVTTELLVQFIEYITNGYYTGNQRIKELIDNRYIVLIPMLNPDGVAYRSRYNANNIDLNRNFDGEWRPYNNHGPFPFSEPESRSLKEYSDYMVFHLSLTFHSGAVVVNMPFDYASEQNGGDVPAEIDLINYMARVYSTSGRFMETEGLLDSQYVDEGTINGGDWYIVYGTLQDWSYLSTGVIDFTVEIIKRSPETLEEINELFDLNRDSIISYIESAGMGIYGRVVDFSNRETPVPARILINGGDIVTQTDAYGFYHRILLPGNYIITFIADEYEEYSEEIEITDELPLIELNVLCRKKYGR